MSALLTNETLQILSWSIALIEFVLALYVLFLNVWHTANRHMSLVLLLFSVNAFAMGILLGANQVTQATFSVILLAFTSESGLAALLLIVLVLVRPQWLQQRRRLLLWTFYILLALPIALTLIDLVWGTRLWYIGLNAQTYAGGYISEGTYVAGTVARVIRPFYVYVMPLLAFVPLLYVALKRDVRPSARHLARLLLAVQFLAIAMQFGLRSLVGSAAAAMATSTFFAFGYAYATFQQMVSDRRVQRGSLQLRLIALTLSVTLPILVALVAFVMSRASDVVKTQAFEKLDAANRSLAANVTLWLDANVNALQQLVSDPAVMSMHPVQQKPVLEAVDEVYTRIYLVSTTDLEGINVARSDHEAPKDYADRLWFMKIKLGAPLAFQTLVGRTSGEPAFVMSAPIRNQAGALVGVGMFASDLDQLADELVVAQFGETGVAYIVDAEDRILAHPDPELAAQLYDVGTLPPVLALRQKGMGEVSFTDEDGVRWYASVKELDNGWGIVVQQAWSELRRPLIRIGTTGLLVLIVGNVLLAVLTFLTMRQAFRPIQSLTETAEAITGGDLSREAPVESEDELGALARAFNSMTRQLRQSIDGLEQRISIRTFDLERRSAYLEASSEVSRAAASILDVDELLLQVVELIRDRFALYYVGLFLVDTSNTWAVLRAGTGEAGQAMLARQHRIRVGEGMIGWSVANAQARIASRAEADAVRVVNPELPDTRSEAALPLRSRGQVLGALSVQSVQPDTFDQDILTVLQTMADQVAVAIANAQLFAQVQASLEAERRAYGARLREAWNTLTQSREAWGYVCERQSPQTLAVSTVQGEWSHEMQQARQTGQKVAVDGSVLAIPIRARDQVIGVLRFDRGLSEATWSEDDVALLEILTDQLGQTLERAQLYQDTQRSAARERMLGQITGRVRQELDMTGVLKTAVDEIQRALNLDRVVVRMVPPDQQT